MNRMNRVNKVNKVNKVERNNLKEIKEFNNFSELKEYYVTVYKTRKTKKSFDTYKNIVSSYLTYPETVKEIIKSMHYMGYWKDYFLLLVALKSAHDHDHNNNNNNNNNKLDELKQFIYTFLVDTLKADMHNNNINNKTTTLAKWLPREKRGFDKKLDFVDYFNKIMFPNIKNKIIARKMYRNIVANLNKKLDTTEIKLCAKQYNDINFSKISPICFKKYYNKFLNYPTCRANMKEYLVNNLINLNVWQFINKLYLKDFDDFTKEVYLEVWEKNKESFYKNLPINTDFLAKCKLFINLSSSIFSDNNINIVIAVTLLKSELNELNELNKLNKLNKLNNIYVLSKKPYQLNLTGNIFDKINTIISNCCCYTTPNILDTSLYDNATILTFNDKNIIDNIIDKNIVGINIFYWNIGSLDNYEIIRKNNNLMVLNNKPVYKKKSNAAEKIDQILTTYTNDNTYYNIYHNIYTKYNIIMCIFIFCIIAIIINYI
jgi:hypothetical protein